MAIRTVKNTIQMVLVTNHTTPGPRLRISLSVFQNTLSYPILYDVIHIHYKHCVTNLTALNSIDGSNICNMAYVLQETATLLTWLVIPNANVPNQPRLALHLHTSTTTCSNRLQRILKRERSGPSHHPFACDSSCSATGPASSNIPLALHTLALRLPRYGQLECPICSVVSNHQCLTLLQ